MVLQDQFELEFAITFFKGGFKITFGCLKLFKMTVYTVHFRVYDINRDTGVII